MARGNAARVKQSKSGGVLAVAAVAPAPSCGCVPGARTGMPRAGIGRGAHAAGVDAGIKAANLKHLRRIEGQVRGIAAMVAQDRYCTDIITQVAAVRESLHSVARNLMRNHLRHCAARALHHGGAEGEAMVEELLGLVGKVAR